MNCKTVCKKIFGQRAMLFYYSVVLRAHLLSIIALKQKTCKKWYSTLAH
jgi:hypothetical protein